VAKLFEKKPTSDQKLPPPPPLAASSSKKSSATFPLPPQISMIPPKALLSTIPPSSSEWIISDSALLVKLVPLHALLKQPKGRNERRVLRGGEEVDDDRLRSEVSAAMSKHTVAAKARSTGIGYSGSAQDATALLASTQSASLRQQQHDEILTQAINDLQSALPRDIFESRSNQNCTDLASDHPLLLETLLGPGYSDGLLLLEPILEESLQTSKISPLIGSDKVVGRGDGVRGASVLLLVLQDLLRSSLMDITSQESRRRLFFATLQLLQSIAKHPDLAGALIFDPQSVVDTSSSLAPSSKKVKLETSSTPKSGYSAWAFPSMSSISQAPKTSALKLLSGLNDQASVYKKRAVHGDATSEVLLGSALEDQEFTAVLCLSADIEVTYSKASDGAASYLERCEFAASCMTHSSSGALEDEPEEIVEPESSSSSSSSSSKVRLRLRAPAKQTNAVVSQSSSSSSRGREQSLFGDLVSSSTFIVKPHSYRSLRDPCSERAVPVGQTKYESIVPPKVEEKYKEILSDEAFSNIRGLKTTHALASSLKTASSTGMSMKRHMKVSAELASMTSLSVSWHGSVLIRSDEASMDLMRAAVVGPPDTPYMNGFWLFDMVLPPDYPDVPPKVLFLTTGGNQARVNPNLYAEGKVCLSLLGTWQGPGWSPGISTLGQVLMSIQSQIMNDTPFANEPGHEARIASPGGKRSVAKHNIAIRLATLRYAILSHLKTPPLGFEIAVKAHFLYKRDEIFGQLEMWRKDARDFAAYEEYLYRRCEELCAVIEVLQDYEKDNASARAQEALNVSQAQAPSSAIPSSSLTAVSKPSPPKKANRKHVEAPLSAAVAVPYSGFASPPLTSIIPSAQLRSLQQEFSRYNSAYISWLTDTSTPSHVVFQSGLGAIGVSTKASLSGYIDDLINASDIQPLAHGAASVAALAMGMSVDVVLANAQSKIQAYKLTGSNAMISFSMGGAGPTSYSSMGAMGGAGPTSYSLMGAMGGAGPTSYSSMGAMGGEGPASYSSPSHRAPSLIGAVSLRNLISARTSSARNQGAFDLAAATMDAISAVETSLKALSESDLI